MDRHRDSQRSVDQQRNEHRAAESADRQAAEGLPNQRSPRTTSGDESIRRDQRASGRMSESEEASDAGVRGTERGMEENPRTRERSRSRPEGVE